MNISTSAWSKSFDRIVGLDRLRAIHMNNSQKGLGSRVDRHAHIGKGMLGAEPFGFIMNDPRLADFAESAGDAQKRQIWRTTR